MGSVYKRGRRLNQSAHYPGVRQRGRHTFQIRYYDLNGERQEETVRAKSAKDAAKERTKRLADVAHGIPVAAKPNTVLFEELCADVVNDYEVNGYRSQSDIEARFRLHILPVFGRRKAATITTAQLKAYIVQRQKDDPAPATGTINRELEAIRHAFKLALDGRKLLAMPKVPHLRETNTRSGFFTREEVDQLCRCLKPPLDAFVLFGFLTGWRYSEIQNLQWRSVDFVKGEIRLDAGTTKNEEGRVFPFSDELRSLLVTQKKRADSLYVFSIGGQRIGAFRKTWKRACHQAGLPCVVDTNGKLVKALRTFHDLRRSFAREMDLQGVRQGAIMKLAGWKTDSVFRRYNVVPEQDLRDAVAKVNRVRNGDNSRSGKRRTQ